MEEVTCSWGKGMSPVRASGSGAGGVKLLSGSGKLVEETPVLYLLDEASAGGLKRPCAPRMGSDLAPRGSVVRLSCLCASASPLLCHCSSWRPHPATAEVQSCLSSELAAPHPCPTLPQVNC